MSSIRFSEQIKIVNSESAVTAPFAPTQTEKAPIKTDAKPTQIPKSRVKVIP